MEIKRVWSSLSFFWFVCLFFVFVFVFLYCRFLLGINPCLLTCVQPMKTLELHKLGQRIESWVNWEDFFLYDSLEITMLYEQWREIIRSYLIRECYLCTKNEVLPSVSNNAMQLRERDRFLQRTLKNICFIFICWIRLKNLGYCGR